ncbi:MAG TPA: MerR family transcriptional regulator [Anaerolineaceae bacterium]|jgi:DNA-binding transcriptional MerR regulator|nr:MerR family transcriptional regulator [Anaerolineaceae bacterium]
MEPVQRTYSIKELASMAGISIRTLHYYDAIGLLVPNRHPDNQYRCYEHSHLLKLQQILFYRELDFPLEQIKNILADPSFELKTALAEQREMLIEREKKIARLIDTIDKTIMQLEGEEVMEDQALYSGFSEERQKEYEKEIRQKYGDEPLNTSMQRWNRLSKAQQKEMIAKGQQFHQKIADVMPLGHESHEALELMRQYWENMQFFYDVSLERFEQLGHMYNQDPAFRSTYETVKPGLAAFMEKAVINFVRVEKQKEGSHE